MLIPHLFGGPEVPDQVTAAPTPVTFLSGILREQYLAPHMGADRSTSTEASFCARPRLGTAAAPPLASECSSAPSHARWLFVSHSVTRSLHTLLPRSRAGGSIHEDVWV